MLLKLDDLARHHHQLSNYGFDCLFFWLLCGEGWRRVPPPPFGVVLCLSALAFLYNILSQSRERSNTIKCAAVMGGGGCYFQYLNQISAMKDFSGI